MALFGKYKINKNYYLIVGQILLLFAIGANIAWLNPGREVAKTNPKIPILWQYSGDASVDFLSGAFFPEYYKVDPMRISRPTFPFLAKIFGELAGLIALPLGKISVLLKTIIGFSLLKIIYFSCGAILLYELVKKWLGEMTAMLSVTVVFFHPHSIRWVAAFSTPEAQFITPIIIIFMFFDLMKNYSHKKNLVYSIIAGVLFLIKENYAVCLALLIFGIFKKKFSAVGMSVVGLLIPQLTWLLTLKLYRIPYFNLHTEQYGQGVWIFTDLFFRHPIEIIQTIMLSLKDWLVMYAEYFTIFLVLALLAFAYKHIKEKFNRPVCQFMGLFLLFSWLQVFAVKEYDSSFRVSDLAFIIFPLGIYTIVQLLGKYGNERQTKRILNTGIALYIILSLISFINLPWVHPYDQKNVLEYKQDRIDKFDQGIIYQK